ncbi:MAG TPA: transposase, partial [Phototrophicaceae bacterium]|nr:transposase [Phototrophicaceae bacterium]
FERHDDFANAFTGSEVLPSAAEDPAQIASVPPHERPDLNADWWGAEPALTDDDSGEETIAHVVLQTALETPPDSLPITDVMSEIETRLAAHKLKIKPLPSWDMDTQTFRPLNETGVMEPDFLPEELPPGEMILPPEDAPELPPSDASSRTTRPSAAVQEFFEPPIQETDTPFDRSYLDETTPSQPLGEAEPAVVEVEPPTLPEPPLVPTWLPEAETEPPPEEASTEWDEPASPFIGLDAELEAEWSLAESPTEAAGEPEAAPITDDWTLPASEPETEALEISSEWTPPEGIPSLEHAVIDEGDDPYIVQMALHLTHASLELTAEGSILTRGDELIAFAGQLSPEDVIELRQIIAIEQRANPDGARFRFISLPSSGKDYMLYSIQTASDFTLSLVFAGSTPLRDIRKQAQRLVEALEAVPETPVVEEEPIAAVVAPPEPKPVAIVVPPPAEPTTPTSAYACVWLLRDPDQRLQDAVAQAIISGLHVQLQEQNWYIRTLQVHEDFVYLLADVPGERPPNELIRELKRRSADIAHAQDPELTPQLLWADSYLVLTPGRDLQTEEILEFINFQRML